MALSEDNPTQGQVDRAVAQLHAYRREIGIPDMYRLSAQIHDAVVLEVPFRHVERVVDEVIPACMSAGFPACASAGFPAERKTIDALAEPRFAHRLSRKLYRHLDRRCAKMRRVRRMVKRALRAQGVPSVDASLMASVRFRKTVIDWYWLAVCLRRNKPGGRDVQLGSDVLLGGADPSDYLNHYRFAADRGLRFSHVPVDGR